MTVVLDLNNNICLCLDDIFLRCVYICVFKICFMHTDRKKPEVATAIVLEKRFPNKDGRSPVKLRITYQRKRKYYAIKGEHFTEKEFEAIMNPDSRGKNKEKRKKFEQIENRAIEIVDNVLCFFILNRVKEVF